MTIIYAPDVIISITHWRVIFPHSAEQTMFKTYIREVQGSNLGHNATERTDWNSYFSTMLTDCPKNAVSFSITCNNNLHHYLTSRINHKTYTFRPSHPSSGSFNYSKITWSWIIKPALPWLLLTVYLTTSSIAQNVQSDDRIGDDKEGDVLRLTWGTIHTWWAQGSQCSATDLKWGPTTAPSGGLLWTRRWIIKFHKRWEISWLVLKVLYVTGNLRATHARCNVHIITALVSRRLYVYICTHSLMYLHETMKTNWSSALLFVVTAQGRWWPF